MELEGFITAALATGCGAIIQWLFSLWAKDRADDGHPVSPRTKRRIMIGLCLLVPSVLIGTLYLITGVYDWQQHVMAIGVAFVSSQVLHGETKLETGEQVATRERLEALSREGGT